jgi:hypothetical protein
MPLVCSSMASGSTTAPCSGLEEILLLDARVYIGERSNATTAGARRPHESRGTMRGSKVWHHGLG